MISILIPTRNEERDLPGCLASVAWSDDIHVYDCYSSDRTRALALAAGAHVVQREFDATAGAFGGNESEHRNWALANIPFKHRWVLHLDADERVTPELQAQMLRAVEQPGDVVAFRIRRRDFLDGRWLRHVQQTPFYLRLFQPQRMRYERLINPVSVPDGPVAAIGGYLDHFPFSKGMQHWIGRHNDYSTFESRQIMDNRRAGAGFSPREAFFAREATVRRFHQKELFYRLPLRPLVKFMLLYVVKRGFLDGRAGLKYSILVAIYEYFIVIKTRELEVAAAAVERPDTGSTADANHR